MHTHITRAVSLSTSLQFCCRFLGGITAAAQAILRFSVAWSVCLSSVRHIRAPCSNRSTDLYAIWQVHLWGPMTHCVRWGPWQGTGDLWVEPPWSIKSKPLTLVHSQLHHILIDFPKMFDMFCCRFFLFFFSFCLSVMFFMLSTVIGELKIIKILPQATNVEHAIAKRQNIHVHIAVKPSVLCCYLANTNEFGGQRFRLLPNYYGPLLTSERLPNRRRLDYNRACYSSELYGLYAGEWGADKQVKPNKISNDRTAAAGPGFHAVVCSQHQHH